MTGTPGRPSHRDLPRTDDLDHPARLLLHGLRPLAAAIARSRWRVQVRGAEHVPRRGPVVLIGNHMGWLDGPLMAILSPRPVHALTKTEMFKGPMRPFLRAAGQIPVHRFEVDPLAVRTGVRVLRDGGVVGMFPEGTRGDGAVRRVRSGSAYLALVTGAPVVPLVFLGTREYGGPNSSLPPVGSRLVLTYGPARSFPRDDWPRRTSVVSAVAEQHRQMLLETLHEAQAATGMVLPGPIPDKKDDRD
ncbi:MAG TPA: lysophospholipid acyltransferase family protein [Marmoricola sp.]|nr:lysophospholipid acyltransferase family protein [Marmoricola sp.]